MKKFVILLFILILVPIIYYFINIEEKANLQNNVLAIVNNDQITIKEYKKRINDIKSNYVSNENIDIKDFKKNILNRLIIEKLILQEAKNKNIQVSEKELNRYIKNIKQSYSEKDFQKILFDQFKTEEEWIQEVKNKILIEKTLSKIITEKINIDDKELLSYYNNYYKDKTVPKTLVLAQIFTTSKEEIEKAEKDLQEGISFEEVVKRYSKSPEASNKGVIGKIQKGEGPEIFDFAFNLKKDEISEILESNHGYHILKVVEINESKNYSFQEAKNHILNEIIYNRENLIYEKWLKRKIKNSKIIKNKKILEYI